MSDDTDGDRCITLSSEVESRAQNLLNNVPHNEGNPNTNLSEICINEVSINTVRIPSQGTEDIEVTQLGDLSGKAELSLEIDIEVGFRNARCFQSICVHDEHVETKYFEVTAIDITPDDMEGEELAQGLRESILSEGELFMIETVLRRSIEELVVE